ncbi:hypothetical protein GCM10008983_05550 [Lentibacillus halophilus]|uniref:Preprotein translocase subunit SecB n=1 Tax=Lentibacillus halophilus TaxID=295065 RepID=A0ABN0Z3Q6_9BACI
MDQEKIFEYYKMAKKNFKMTNAFLEDVTVEKYQDIPVGGGVNEVSFGKRYDKIDDQYKGFLKTTILCRDNNTNEVVMKIEVVYSGVFESTGLGQAEMEEYVEAQIVPQLLSYARSIITHLTSLMSIPPIQLPTMDVIQSLYNNQHVDNGDV